MESVWLFLPPVPALINSILFWLLVTELLELLEFLFIFPLVSVTLVACFVSSIASSKLLCLNYCSFTRCFKKKINQFIHLFTHKIPIYVFLFSQTLCLNYWQGSHLHLTLSMLSWKLSTQKHHEKDFFLHDYRQIQVTFWFKNPTAERILINGGLNFSLKSR